MTQPAATFDNVAKAIDQILAEKRNPTLDAIQAIVGGNKATIARERAKVFADRQGESKMPRPDKEADTALPQVEKNLRGVGAQLEKLSAAYRADLSNAMAEERARGRADIEFATKTLVDENERLKLDNAELVAELEIAEAKLQIVLGIGPRVEELLKHLGERDLANGSKCFAPGTDRLSDVDAANSAAGGGVRPTHAVKNNEWPEAFLVPPKHHSSPENKEVESFTPPVESLLALFAGRPKPAPDPQDGQTHATV